jgi:hypothetical protein
MMLLDRLADFGMAAFGLAILAALAAAHLLGRKLGLWHQRSTAEHVEATSFVTSGVLALLAFVLGMTIAMAQGRYETRRALVLDEANAIGTAWLRAGAIGHPRGAAIATLLERYTAVRIAFVNAAHDSPEIAEAHAETGRMQAVMWGHMAAILATRTDPVAVALQASLNDTFDLATSTRWALAARLPGELIALLLGMCFIAMGTMGYQFGLKGTGQPALTGLLVLLWTACLIIVADLSTARLGLVRADAAPYAWTAESFAGGIRIPPLP